jgi:hypothetical protein
MSDNNFPGLRLGDQLPAVGVLQRLLVRAGYEPGIDCDFGAGTDRALRKFQKDFGLSVNGKTDPWTWHRLLSGESLPILDVVDIFDGTSYEGKVLQLQKYGASPIVLGGMCNGLEQAITMVLRVAPPELFMLRFFGHGAPGAAGVSTGHGELTGGRQRDLVRTADLEDDYETQFQYTRLRGLFGPYGCVQFMHCSTGHGTTGQRFIEAMAGLVSVPVSAGIDTQYSGGSNWETWFYEGPTRTRVPGGRSMASWARGRPPFMTAPVSTM